MDKFQARQGDVLIKRVKQPARNAKPVNWQKEGRVVLAYGEVTGHAHALSLNFASMVATEAGQRFLNTKEGAVVKHEEHSAINLAPGCYEIVQQREYTPQAIRNVAD